jgi:dienelactone hydrolase
MTAQTIPVEIPAGRDQVAADLVLPDRATGLVIFAHGSGSSRHSPRNQAVARALQQRGLGTLLADLLTPSEEVVDDIDAHLRFDIDFLGHRLLRIIDWTRSRADLASHRLGLFGASTGAAAALVAAAERPRDVVAVVSRGGRPDLAGSSLPLVTAPTLLIVGGLDTDVIELNEWARSRMHCPVTLDIVHGATHLFEEPGTLEQVAALAGEWFVRYLGAAPTRGRGMPETHDHAGRRPHGAA